MIKIQRQENTQYSFLSFSFEALSGDRTMATFCRFCPNGSMDTDFSLTKSAIKKTVLHRKRLFSFLCTSNTPKKPQDKQQPQVIVTKVQSAPKPPPIAKTDTKYRAESLEPSDSVAETDISSDLQVSENSQ
jgi:hypothetical protein